MALGKNMKIDRLVPVSNIQVNENLSLQNVDSASDSNFNYEEDLKGVDLEKNEAKLNSNSESIALSEELNSEQVPNSFQYQDIENESIKISFRPSRRKTQKRILIDIEGSITINNVELMHSQVHQVFENYDFVEVTLKNITDVDLTAVQLFHAIRVTYYPQNKFISINAELTSQDRKLLNTCGFTEFQTQVTATV